MSTWLSRHAAAWVAFVPSGTTSSFDREALRRIASLTIRGCAGILHTGLGVQTIVATLERVTDVSYQQVDYLENNDLVK